tara:strand:- start:156 stop:566 length:411 start_codon:yes stop_codon:yes gene_type:complete
VAESKNDPPKSDDKQQQIGKHVDIVEGSEPEQETEPVSIPTAEQKAVAIKDSSQSGTMPRVVASGQGTFAEQILQIAWANGIRVREDADLVEVLSAIDIDSEIPIEAFAAVAEILAYVYRANAGQIPINDLKENDK